MAKKGKGPTAALPTAARNPTTLAGRTAGRFDTRLAYCRDDFERRG
jgi:hypothetical protein